MLLDPDRVHVEISSRCVLKCPRCPRTELSLPNLNREIGLDLFRQGFPPEDLARIRGMVFCGHIGDPIYATEFLDVVSYVRENSRAQLGIITNGSYRKIDWWQRLAQLLLPTDRVVFSVDGWDQQSNDIYRRNGDFDSILDGIRTLRQHSQCHISWSTIYFKFNENDMDRIQRLAQSLGCDQFRAVRSSKFDGNYLVNGIDPLKPSRTSQTAIYEADVHHFTDRPDMLFVPSVPLDVHPWARCMNHKKEVFVDVDGTVLPCAWFGDGYYSHQFIDRNRDRLNIRNRCFSQILADPVWFQFLSELDGDNLPTICQIKCKNAAQSI